MANPSGREGPGGESSRVSTVVGREREEEPTDGTSAAGCKRGQHHPLLRGGPCGQEYLPDLSVLLQKHSDTRGSGADIFRKP